MTDIDKLVEERKIEKGSATHAALAFVVALLETGRTSAEILAAVDVVRAALTLSPKKRKVKAGRRASEGT